MEVGKFEFGSEKLGNKLPAS